jgi:hypothetical protein
LNYEAMKYRSSNSNRREAMRSGDSRPLEDLVDQLMRAYGLESKMQELTVLEAWPELMGVAVANRTSKLTIRNRVLRVKMDSAVMRDELAAGKAIILDRVNQFAGKEMITDIWFE